MVERAQSVLSVPRTSDGAERSGLVVIEILAGVAHSAHRVAEAERRTRTRATTREVSGNGSGIDVLTRPSTSHPPPTRPETPTQHARPPRTPATRRMTSSHDRETDKGTESEEGTEGGTGDSDDHHHVPLPQSIVPAHVLVVLMPPTPLL